MNTSFWRPSAGQRRTILLLEALGLIHDLGKLSDSFLAAQAPSSNLDYNHNLLVDLRQINTYQHARYPHGNQVANIVREWFQDTNAKPCAFSERHDLTDILKRIQFTDWAGEQYNLAELIPLVGKPGLKKHLSADWQAVLGKAMTPGILIGFLHGIAHIEKEGEPQQYKQPYSHVFRASPFGLEEQIQTGLVPALTDALRALPLADIEHVTSQLRCQWLAQMNVGMALGIADNRRPHNEIPLWDWGFITAAMTKAAANYIFKNGFPSSIEDIPFRTFCITINRLECYANSNKISDLLGVKQELDKAFADVKTLLEETYALGNCIYHDESGAYYLFSDLGYSDQENTALRQTIQECFPTDLRPLVWWGDPIKAGDLDQNKKLSSKLVAELRQKALQQPLIHTDNNLYLPYTEWNSARPLNAETCTVCGARPVGYPSEGSDPNIEANLATWATQVKATSRKVCRICLNRRGRRAQEWLNGNLSGTIWIDEVADSNGRLALFVGKLGLDGWLDGSLLETIQVTNNTTKQPSPARLYRIAETARSFWHQVSAFTARQQHAYRFALYPANSSLNNLGDFHAYELDVDGISLSTLWDPKHKRFLTIDNLVYFAQRRKVSIDRLSSILSNRIFDIYEPSEFGQRRQQLCTISIGHVEKLGLYNQSISIITEPSICMLIIPASDALELIRNVKDAYEQQMGRIRDRLPLYVGLVFFQRRTPIRAVLDAGKAMLAMSGVFDISTGAGWEGWRLIKNTNQTSFQELCFDHGITWRIPVVAGDCTTPDIWYPRLYEGDSWTKRRSKHISELRERNPQMPPNSGYKVWVRPSYFDFTFLDASARRFELHYDAQGRRSRSRPWYLEDVDRLERLWEWLRRLTPTQRYQIVRAIEETRELWYGPDTANASPADPVFRRFVADTLAGAEWQWAAIPAEWQIRLIEAGARGELADVVELHMEILKESL